MEFKSLEEQIAEQEQYPEEIKREMDRSFLIITGICWQAFITKDDIWVIRVIDLNDLEKYMWLRVRVIKEDDGSVNERSFHFDHYSDNLTEVLKYKYLYLTELNHYTISDMFMGAYSEDEDERDFYKSNIHRFSELEE